MESVIWMTIKEALKSMWESPYKILKTLIVISITLFFSTYTSVWWVKNKLLPKIFEEQSIDNILNDDGIDDAIKNNLRALGVGSFSSWIRYECGNNYDLFVFKDVYGYLPNWFEPFSIKDKNSLYKEVHRVDENTRKYINSQPVLAVNRITKKESEKLGLQKISEVFDRQKIGIDAFKFIIVKDENNCITWVFSICFLDRNRFESTDGDDELRRIAFSESQRISRKKNDFIIKMLSNSNYH